jgi:hypothetical protein
MRAATSSISHLGVDVAPHMPARRTSSGKGAFIDEASEIKTV